ncbi:MAG: UvrD-helicase domain-containing protein [Patescibacteria group bacterium]|nr:UvrD-helicase domain-containing protein [Patescibacteria group bacterium]MDE2172683.1 UvrD-helicase domain-containing protein [Patescibacteria group bacterium]
MSLNDQQKKAVEIIDGPVLIIAGAGAGKTRVITHRILNLIRNGVAPHEILAITFTNKASKEMRERVHALLAENVEINRPITLQGQPFISTFHALGVHIIREHAGILGLTRHFSIYDRADSRRAVKEAMAECAIDPKKFDPGTILNMISRAKGDGQSQAEYADRAQDYMQETVADIWEKYDAIVAKDKALDFDDLLLKTAQLLGRHEQIRRHYAAVWRYIHVDEYQDTNKVQYQITKYLASAHRNLCVVGDADQNIYSWRGATIENILNFEKDYPEATVILLEKNYRSTKTILAAANSVIEKNKLRKKKNLFTDNEDGEKIGLMISYTEADESRAIADKARELIAAGISPRNIAVLYRANFLSRVLEEAFIKKQVPYQLVGVRFFERKEVKDVLSYIRAALNKESPTALPNGGWADIARIINVPPRGIGKATIAKISAGQESSLPNAMRAKLANFWKLLDDIRQHVREESPSEAVRFVLQETGIEKLLRSGDSEDEERLLNARELVSVAAQYDHLPPEEGIESLLSNAALATDQDDLATDQEAVKLMTVHASKGLEFDHVFIAGMEQDLFPFKHLDEADTSESEKEEERRLFYVALTRARKKVYLSYTIIRTVYGAQRINMPSEFIDDIDRELIDSPHEPQKPSGAKALFIDF